MSDLKDSLKEYIKEKFLAGSISDALSYDSRLLDEQIIDSSGVLVLIMHIEKTYDITIDDAELVPENFNSIDDLAELIERKFAQRKVG